MKKTDYKDKTREELIKLLLNYSATMQKVSKLYLKSKTENDYLKRRNKILEDRLKHMTKISEKKNGCHITFGRIDALVRRENKIKNRPKIKFEDSDKNDNAKNKGIQS